MSLVEGCKHELEITVPVEEIQQETDKVVANIQKRAKLPGFRPGKAPTSLIRTRFKSEIQQDVLEHILPKAFRARAEQDQLQIVGTPNVKDVHFHDGEPLKFKAEFEVMPEIELGSYTDLPVPYDEPKVEETQIDERIAGIRDQKAEYVNQDPRPLEDGDFAVVHLKSLHGIEGEPIDNPGMMLHIGDPETMAEFTENLRGASPGDVKEFDVKYPDDYGQERMAGKTVHFQVEVQGVRKKELPDLNDEFARDLGDFQSLDELREAVRKSLFAEADQKARNEAKDKLIDQLVANHEFPVPETFVDRQIEAQVEGYLRTVASRGVDPRQLKLDWNKIKESQREKAMHDVKASLLLEKIADKEAIHATQDEVDKEVQRIAKQDREPVAAVRMKLEKEGALGRIANRIRTEKILNFLFEKSRKTAA